MAPRAGRRLNAAPVRAALDDQLAVVYSRAARESLVMLGVDPRPEFGADNRAVRALARRRSGELFDRVFGTASKRARLALSKELRETRDPHDIAARLRERFSGVGARQARMAVRTEIRDLYNTASLDAWSAVGVRTVIASDGHGGLTGETDAACLARNGKRYTIAQARGQHHSPVTHPNCTLSWQPFVPKGGLAPPGDLAAALEAEAELGLAAWEEARHPRDILGRWRSVIRQVGLDDEVFTFDGYRMRLIDEYGGGATYAGREHAEKVGLAAWNAYTPDGALIGTVMGFKPRVGPEDAPRFYVSSAYVAPDHRNTDTGLRLFQAVAKANPGHHIKGMVIGDPRLNSLMRRYNERVDEAWRVAHGEDYGIAAARVLEQLADDLLALDFNPAEPRDRHGRWTRGGATGLVERAAETVARITRAVTVQRDEVAPGDRYTVDGTSYTFQGGDAKSVASWVDASGATLPSWPKDGWGQQRAPYHLRVTREVDVPADPVPPIAGVPPEVLADHRVRAAYAADHWGAVLDMDEIYDILGYNGKPRQVDRLRAPVYHRGVSKQRYIEDYRDGPRHYPSRGWMGDGTYFGGPGIASQYGPYTYEIGLAPGARVAEGRDIEARLRSDPALARLVGENVGAAAALLGYQAFYPRGVTYDSNRAYPDIDEWIVVLDRAATEVASR